MVKILLRRKSGKNVNPLHRKNPCVVMVVSSYPVFQFPCNVTSPYLVRAFSAIQATNGHSHQTNSLLSTALSIVWVSPAIPPDPWYRASISALTPNLTISINCMQFECKCQHLSRRTSTPGCQTTLTDSPATNMYYIHPPQDHKTSSPRRTIPPLPGSPRRPSVPWPGNGRAE